MMSLECWVRLFGVVVDSRVIPMNLCQIQLNCNICIDLTTSNYNSND